MTVDLFTKPKNGFACGGTARLKSAKGESESTVHKRVALGEIPPPCSVGGRSLWRLSDLEKWAGKLTPGK